MTVDDVAGMLPAGELVAMRDLLGHVRLVSPADLRVFQEMTGLTGQYRPGGHRRAPGRSATVPIGPGTQETHSATGGLAWRLKVLTAEP
ncbi:hypothetical protein ACXIZN_04820 [Amycolatopsis sp. TRM77291]